MARTARGEFFLWGSNRNQQCLVAAQEERFDYQRDDVKFAKVPTKFEHAANDERAEAMYLGYAETLLVVRRSVQRKGAVMGERSAKKRTMLEIESLQRKINRLKAWCHKLKSANSSKRKSATRDDSDEQKEVELDDEEEKYVDDRDVPSALEPIGEGGGSLRGGGAAWTKRTESKYHAMTSLSECPR